MMVLILPYPFYCFYFKYVKNTISPGLVNFINRGVNLILGMEYTWNYLMDSHASGHSGDERDGATKRP